MAPQARIKINGVEGSNTDLPIDTLVQLDNLNGGGETSYTWSITDQPPGTTDSLSATNIQNPTFTPKKEGTYRLQLVVDSGLPTEQTDHEVAGILQIKTRERVPAAGETTEGDTADGWATPANAWLRRLDSLLSDPGVVVGVSSGSLTKGDVVRCSGTSTLKSGLPGQETVPLFAKVNPATADDLNETLGVLEGGVDGSPSPAPGAVVQVRIVGRFSTAFAGSTPVVGQPVLINSSSQPMNATAPLTSAIVRCIGHVAAVSGSNFDLWVDGRMAGAPVVFVQTATGFTPVRVRRIASATEPLTTWETEAAVALAKLRETGDLEFIPTAAVGAKWPNFWLRQESSTEFGFAKADGTRLATLTDAGNIQANGTEVSVNENATAALAENPLVTLKGGDGVGAPNDDVVRTRLTQDSLNERTELTVERNRNGGGYNRVSVDHNVGKIGDTTASIEASERVHGATGGGTPVVGRFKAKNTPAVEVGSESNHEVHLIQNGSMAWKVDTSGNLVSTSSKAIQGVTDPTNAQDAATRNYVLAEVPKVNPMIGLGNSTVCSAAGVTEYCDPWFASRTTPSTEAKMPVTRAGTLQKMRIRARVGPVDDSIVFTVRKNGVDTGITATLAAAGTTASDLVNTATVAAGDDVSVKAVAGGSLTTGALDCVVSLEFAS